MRWKIVGVNQSTGREWQVTILARDAADAEAQGRFYRQVPVPVADADTAASNIADVRSPSKILLAIFLVPLIVLALIAKSVLLAISTLRRMMVS